MYLEQRAAKESAQQRAWSHRCLPSPRPERARWHQSTAARDAAVRRPGHLLRQSLVPCPCHHWFQAESGWQEFLEVLRKDRGDAEERQKPH